MTQRATDVINRAFASEGVEEALDKARTFLHEGSDLTEELTKLAHLLAKQVGDSMLLEVADEDLPVVRACGASIYLIFTKLLEQ